MKNNSTLKDKIVQSVFLYETKQITLRTTLKLLILLASLGIAITFGGVLVDFFVESEILNMSSDFVSEGSFSPSSLSQYSGVIFGEIPLWLIICCVVAIIAGCILIMSIIRNWKRIYHKINSIIKYWFQL